MIAIKSNKDLMFPPSFKGIITMKIDLIQNKPEQEIYELRIIDTCTKEVDEEQQVPVKDKDGNFVFETQLAKVNKVFGKEVVRFKTMTYDELDQLTSILKINMSDKSKLRENINELFRLGLLAITQKECVEGQGNYFSEAQDWEIVR